MSTGAGPSAANTRSRSVAGSDGVLAAARWASRVGSAGVRACCRAHHRASASITSSASVTSVAPVLEPVGAFGARVERMAGNREHLASLLGGIARGDERARSRAASTITTPETKPEMMRLRRGKSLSRGWKPGRHLGDEAAALADPALQLGVLGRIDPVEAAGEHGDGAALQRRCRGRRDRCRGPGPRR